MAGHISIICKNLLRSIRHRNPIIHLLGVWLDNSEPDYGVYDFENYRYMDAPALSVSNMYPQMYSRIFYDKMKDLGDGNVVNLLRCAESWDIIRSPVAVHAEYRGINSKLVPAD